MFYRIKPVFVFDGKCPELKKNTIAKRADQRLKAVNKSRQSSIKIIENYIASQMSSSRSQLPSTDRLPTLESSLIDMPDNKDFKVYEELAEMERNKEISEDSDTSDLEPKIALSYGEFQNIESMDVNSDDFKALPPDVRYEILTEIKQKYKGYRNTDIMPKESNDFSNYQMQKLLKKRGIQSKIEETIKHLNGQQSEDILQDWDKKGYKDDSRLNIGQLVSDENVRFVLLKKSQPNTSQSSLPTEELIDNLDVASTSQVNSSFKSIDSIENSSNSCLIISDSSSSECEPEIEPASTIKPPMKNPCDEISVPILREPKTQDISKDVSNPVLEAFIFDDIIEISDESDDELNINKQINKGDPKTYDELIEDKKKTVNNNNQKNTKNNEFTKIKCLDKEESDSSDDFEEVLSEQKNENYGSNEETIKISNESEEPILIEKSNEHNLEKSESLPMQKLTSSNNRESLMITPHITSPSKIISREELVEVTREMNKQNRFANHVNQQMMIDCQELLSLFGIPYVVSPTEAEAQCAALEELGLTEGTITDDSDVLLFGAQTVFKNFFTSSKYVELFKAEDIESRFGLTRSSLICIAMLCGSDYTDGVEGVGAVKATEILSEFPGEGLDPLIELKNWWQNKHNSGDKRPENAIRAKLIKLKLNESFPNRVVFDAYMKPTVDTSKEKFVWGVPRLDELRDYTRLRFGWSVDKCDQILLPIMKKVNEKQVMIN